jgi:hypothetical protein
MKWFLFFICFTIFSCNQQRHENQNKASHDSVTTIVHDTLPKEKIKTYLDSFEADFISINDTGYFKNLAVSKVSMLGYQTGNQLHIFLDNLVSKKDVILLNKEALSHSCKITDKGNIRFDTLRNGKISFIQKQIFGFQADEDNGSAVLKINGKIVKAISVVESEYEPFLDFNPSSFRNFLFHGKEFYYIQAKYTLSQGGSMGNVTYHLLYNVALNKLFYVNSCRLDDWVPFGDINNDEDLDLIDFGNSDFCTTVPSSDRVIIQFYSYKNGDFDLQKDKSGKPYTIEGNTGINYTQDSFKVKKSYWPVKIK